MMNHGSVYFEKVQLKQILLLSCNSSKMQG